MRNIVIEGADAAGKSTLANKLLQHLPLTLQKSEGPPKYPGEMVERIRRYLKMDRTLFDRHPCISQPIYDLFREQKTEIPVELIDTFYQQQNLIIYLYGTCGPHEVKDHETEDHVKMVEKYEDNIRNAYEAWAPGNSNIMYRATTDDFDRLLNACQEYLR